MNVISLEKILDHICQTFDISNDDIKSKSREQNIVNARYVYFYFASKYTFKSAIIIAKLVNKGRTSVYHAIQESENKYNTKLNKMINKVTF